MPNLHEIARIIRGFSVFPGACGHAEREHLGADVFQICLKNDQLRLALRQTWPILEVSARRIPPSGVPIKVLRDRVPLFYS